MHSISDGESPPPAPKGFFGREELIEEVVKIAENLQPIALIGAGGIGKTSIARTVLHHGRIEELFGGNRRFICCDKFPVSRPHFLARLSEVIGAGVENPEDITPLRPFLSSEKMFIVLDNAESILDPHGPNHEEIYAVVDELCQFETICVCITSRITTVPRYCKRPQIPMLSMEAAKDIFYGIYSDRGHSEAIDELLKRLDFHALSITLLATTASDNVWDYGRLAKEWDLHHAQVLRTDHDGSLAATIELSLDSPTFRKLGPNARDLLGVVAFFPQGVDEENFDQLFPTITDGKVMFDKFCTLSLTHRSGNFITMLAPIREHLCPRDPKSSPLLRATKDRYFARLSVDFNTNKPRYGETRWIVSEDVNVEHLLDVFASDGADTGAWGACVNFMHHLHWQKPRQTVLRSKIEGLPDDHPSKAECLFVLSRLYGLIGNKAEQRRLLDHTLELGRQRRDFSLVAQTLRFLSRTSPPSEGIQQAEEALEMFERLGDLLERAKCLGALAWLLLRDNKLDAAERAALHKIDLLQNKGEEYMLCRAHCLLGAVYSSKREKGKAIHHFEAALTIVSAFGCQGAQFWIHYSLAVLFFDERDFNRANTHIEQARSHAGENMYKKGRGMHMQAWIWYQQRRLEEARSEAQRALVIFESLEAADIEECKKHLQEIEGAMESQVSAKLDSGGKFPSPGTSHPC